MYLHEKVFALEIKPKQVIPPEISGTISDFTLDKPHSKNKVLHEKKRGTPYVFSRNLSSKWCNYTYPA